MYHCATWMSYYHNPRWIKYQEIISVKKRTITGKKGNLFENWVDIKIHFRAFWVFSILVKLLPFVTEMTEISDEDDAEKIDLPHIVGKEPGQDLVVTSWASGQQQSRNMEIHLTAAAWSDILNHSEIILPAFLPNISSARSVAIFSSFPSSYPEIVFFPGISHSSSSPSSGQSNKVRWNQSLAAK